MASHFWGTSQIASPDPEKPGAVRLHRAAPAVELRSLMQMRFRSPIDTTGVLLSRAHNEAVLAAPATDYWTAV
ncbi:hypothetical protein V7S43_006815 [Phytophthora oleae]|uniref:Uncharacterized protein n=1 Tax=Phytophthora oleae TaxID=2107226 RepID=A0ABD3FM29_9STRA